MEKGEKFKIGKTEYINENCWLVKTLNYNPYKRCQHCELKFRNCLFLQYQIISLFLIVFFLILSFLIEGKISELIIISVFTLVIVYGYFFNTSTDKIIQANFAQRKAKEAVEELNERLQEKVDEQTKEIRKAYEVEKKARKELERLDKAKDQFMMATQHHLRTPLTSMQGYLDLLLGGSYGKISKRVKEVLQKHQSSTKNEIKIVNELLDISQFQLGKQVVSLQSDIKVESILKEIIEELKPEAEKKRLYLKFEKPKTQIRGIKADTQKLKVALFNIIDNGIKYTQQGGVTIKLEIVSLREISRREKNYKLKIIVRDTGMGIPKEELKDLFAKTFERGEEAKKVWGPGKGIGLFLTHQIIKAHNGEIRAESEGKNKGSTFYVELPINPIRKARAF